MDCRDLYGFAVLFQFCVVNVHKENLQQNNKLRTFIYKCQLLFASEQGTGGNRFACAVTHQGKRNIKCNIRNIVWKQHNFEEFYGTLAKVFCTRQHTYIHLSLTAQQPFGKSSINQQPCTTHLSSVRVQCIRLMLLTTFFIFFSTKAINFSSIKQFFEHVYCIFSWKRNQTSGEEKKQTHAGKQNFEYFATTLILVITMIVESWFDAH